MTDQDKFANDVVDHMMENDLFSQWLGVEVLEVRAGYSKIKMTVRKEMINGFGIVHGGIAFSLSDSAFAFACNNRNVLSVALDTAINFLKPVHVGDVLTAEAKEIHNGKSTGLYQISIVNQKDHVVALFKGTCFRTDKKLILSIPSIISFLLYMNLLLFIRRRWSQAMLS
jgi:acyl-CoA thioesterase